MLDEEEKNAALSDKKEAYVITLHLFVPTIFLSIHCHYTSYVVCHIIRHIYAPILLIFHPFLKTIRQASSQVNTRIEVETT